MSEIDHDISATMCSGFLARLLLALTTVFPLAGSAAALCSGDCNGDGTVAVSELARAIQIALTDGPTTACTAVDADGDGSVRINELVRAAYALLNDCRPFVVFSQRVNVSNTSLQSQEAAVSRDAAGNINVVWAEGDILFSRSLDGGGTFSAPVYVQDPNDPFGSENSYSSEQVKVASPSDTVHVVWTIFDLIGGGAEIFYAYADHGAATFSSPLMISPNDGVNSITASVAADGKGNIGIVWSDFNVDTLQEAVSYSRCNGSGCAFSAPLLLADSGLCPSIALSSDNVYVVWTVGNFGQEQILFSRSIDGGDSFSTPIVVDNYPEKSWCPQISVAADGRIYVLWEEGAAFEDGKILLSRSVDDGVSFSSPLLLSDPTMDSSCPSLAIDDSGRVFATWTIFGFLPIGDSFLAFSDGSESFFSPLKIPSPVGGGGGCYATVAVAPDQIGLVWNSFPETPADIFYRTGQLKP